MCLASVFFAILGRRLPPPLASLLPSSCNGNKPQSPPACAPPAGSAHTISSCHQSVSLPTPALRSDPTALLLLFRKRENLKFILFLARGSPETPVGGPSQKKVESGTRYGQLQESRALAFQPPATQAHTPPAPGSGARLRQTDPAGLQTLSADASPGPPDERAQGGEKWQRKGIRRTTLRGLSEPTSLSSSSPDTHWSPLLCRSLRNERGGSLSRQGPKSSLTRTSGLWAQRRVCMGVGGLGAERLQEKGCKQNGLPRHGSTILGLTLRTYHLGCCLILSQDHQGRPKA